MCQDLRKASQMVWNKASENGRKEVSMGDISKDIQEDVRETPEKKLERLKAYKEAVDKLKKETNDKKESQ